MLACQFTLVNLFQLCGRPFWRLMRQVISLHLSSLEPTPLFPAPLDMVQKMRLRPKMSSDVNYLGWSQCGIQRVKTNSRLREERKIAKIMQTIQLMEDRDKKRRRSGGVTTPEAAHSNANANGPESGPTLKRKKSRTSQASKSGTTRRSCAFASP